MLDGEGIISVSEKIDAGEIIRTSSISSQRVSYLRRMVAKIDLPINLIFDLEV